ncbi:MAG: hypothetical protein KF836_10835 [Fimbriimonadaceae bacterium]|nr:hypothetical protein [Fimbriimonadaceae bacterium]
MNNQDSVMLKVLRSQGCMTVAPILLIITVIAIPIFAYKVFVDVMAPPPNSRHFTYFETQIAADGLPIEAESLIACELDRPSYVGEGKLTKSWADILASAPNKNAGQSTIVVRTKEGDFARVRLLVGDRVRVLTGSHLEYSEVNTLFDEEFETGKGKHPPFKKPE